MNCEEALVLISGCLDGINTEEEMTQLRIHLEACADCRQLFDTMQEIDGSLADLKAEPPADLKANIMEVVCAEAKLKRKQRRWIPAAVAAALFLAVGAVQVDQLRDENTVSADASEAAAPAAYARAVFDTPAYDAENGFFVEPSAELDSQTLADRMGGDVAVTRELLPEMEVCSCETLEDGTLLYHMERDDAAEKLSEAYDLELFRPTVEIRTDQSYVRLVP